MAGWFRSHLDLHLAQLICIWLAMISEYLRMIKIFLLLPAAIHYHLLTKANYSRPAHCSRWMRDASCGRRPTEHLHAPVNPLAHSLCSRQQHKKDVHTSTATISSIGGTDTLYLINDDLMWAASVASAYKRLGHFEWWDLCFTMAWIRTNFQLSKNRTEADRHGTLERPDASPILLS